MRAVSPLPAGRVRATQPLARTADDAEAYDAELVRRLAAGEPDALGQAYDFYAASLYRVLQALLGSPTDAEDALQEVFVKIATGRVSQVRDLRAYLFVAARHEALTMLRRRKREGQLDAGEIPARIAPRGGFEQAADWQALLALLPLEQREVIALKVWEQLTFAEIAAIVKASPNTVMSRYRYGIERLRVWCREEDADGP